MKSKWIILESIIIVILLGIVLILLKRKSGLEQATIEPVVNNKDTAITEIEVETDMQEITNNDSSVDLEKQKPSQIKPYPLKDITGDGKVNLVVFADCTWDDKRGEDGISEQLEALTGANVYNCSIGGTNAALVDESIYAEDWDSRSLNGMVYIARGTVTAESQLTDEAALSVFKKIDFTQVDYVIFSYGTNDYLLGVDISAIESMYDMTTYYGAIRHAADILPQAFPQLKVIIVSPTYCNYGGMDSTTNNNGKGTLEDYVEVARIVTVTTERPSYFVDAYHDFGINADTADMYLTDDGIHLSAEGREKYAEQLAYTLSKMEF